MSNVVPFVGVEYNLEAFGQTWTLSRWDLDVWDPLLSWCRLQLPDPLDVAAQASSRIDLECQQLADDLGRMQQTEPRGRAKDFEKLYQAKHHRFEALRNQQELITRMALEQATAYLSPVSAAVQSLLLSPRGMAHVLWLLLQQHHPQLDENAAWAISQAQPDGEVGKAFRVTQGKLPPATSDPNASAPAVV